MKITPGNIVGTWKVWVQFVTTAYSILNDSETIDTELLLAGAWMKLTGPCNFVLRSLQKQRWIIIRGVMYGCSLLDAISFKSFILSMMQTQRRKVGEELY